jgi:5-dehydro-2-deoxygluconokinase
LKPPSAAGWRVISEVIEHGDPFCKGVVLLGLDAAEDSLREGFLAAQGYPLWRGFAVGRSIFRSAAERWFAGGIDDADAQASVAESYRRMIDVWRQSIGAAPPKTRPARKDRL